MLPEHVTMLKERKNKQTKKQKPSLDEQVIEELEYKIQSFYKLKEEAIFTVFGEYRNRNYAGLITKIDPLTNRIKIASDSGGERYTWIKFEDIIKIEKKQS